jgi:hypothetical protein
MSSGHGLGRNIPESEHTFNQHFFFASGYFEITLDTPKGRVMRRLSAARLR